MERRSSIESIRQTLTWIFNPQRAYEKERLRREEEIGEQIKNFRVSLETPEMRAKVEGILEKYSIVGHSKEVILSDRDKPMLLIEPTYKEVFKRIIKNQKPPIVYFIAGPMNESGVPGQMWFDVEEVRIISNQDVEALLGGVFNKAQELGYKKYVEKRDKGTEITYGRFVLQNTEPSMGYLAH